MHLKSLTLKGFKSFPDRTKLDFGPGVSVVVGPNGSGKSNVTDAVLWAMGEQSPLAVRGQSMRDVIFGGGRGVQARSAAEVEIVIDNADGAVDVPLGEISILRRLDRSGEGEYRLNGARCRLVDVLEVLSDTGLGKEMHSVVSQGRVETIVTSKPRERRLLIEEAAGLGKHRKRRRRAQLKLERTQDNLDRALDVEREARSRLRPLKRQAEAAELHERIERQTVEARWELVRDLARARRADLAAASAAATAARAARDGGRGAARGGRGAPPGRRRGARRPQRAARGVRAARLPRALGGRAHRAAPRAHARRSPTTCASASSAAKRELEALEAGAEHVAEGSALEAAGRERIAALEAELERLAADHEAELERELVDARARPRARPSALVAQQREAADVQRALLASAEATAETARGERRDADRALEAARREAARVGAELAACNQFLRTRAGSSAHGRGARSLADALDVRPGYERAVAAALGGLLRAGLVEGVRDADALLDAAGAEGGRVLITGDLAPGPARATHPPAPGARHLCDFIEAETHDVAVARRLLWDAWVVEEIHNLPPGFNGIATTRDGRVWHGRHRELRQAPEGGEERVLAERNRREELIAASGAAVAAEEAAQGRVRASPSRPCAPPTRAREEADRARRDGSRALAGAEEDARRAAWLIAKRREAPLEGASAVRRAQLEGELAAERRVAERAERERAERARRIAGLRHRIAADRALEPGAARLAAALDGGRRRRSARASRRSRPSSRPIAPPARTSPRGCAPAPTEEAEIQRRLRERGELVTAAEVRAQQARDQAAEADHELAQLAERLGLPAEPADGGARRGGRGRAARADRAAWRAGASSSARSTRSPRTSTSRRSSTSPSSRRSATTSRPRCASCARSSATPTARSTRRSRRRSTPPRANFEELAAQMFPGGRGRLRLVKEEQGITGFAGAAGRRRAERRRRRRRRRRRGRAARRARRHARRRDRDHAGGQVDEAPDAAVGR